MAYLTRTYLPSDWKIWTYKPVAGKFRLDFSELNGSDVLGGATDVGSIQQLGLTINSIELENGQRPDQSVFFSFIPGTMALSAQLLEWDSTLVQELYNGKQIFLTLKNEAVNSHAIFGKNTVFFIGHIDSLNIDVDPINQVTNLTITAVDVAGAAVNQAISVTKGVSKGYAIQQGLLDAQSGGYISPYLSFALFAILGTSWQTTGSYNTTLGELMAEYISAEVAVQTNSTFQSLSGGVDVTLQIAGSTIAGNPGTGRTIPESVITNLVIGQEGANVPTAFDLSNDVANYNIGTTSANTLTNPTVYSNTMDVPTASLSIIANKIREYTSNIQPTEVTVKTGATFSRMRFDDLVEFSGGDFFYPYYIFHNGQEVKVTSTYTGETTNHTIVGVRHTIDPDNWESTYQLWKGL